MLLPLSQRLVYALGMGLLAMSLSGSPSRAEGPFDNMRGSWTGNGVITMSSGANERIRCRASYQPSGTTVKMSLRCASDSYKFELASELISTGGKLSGSWSEVTRQVEGNVTGTATPGNIQATAMSPLFSAFLSLKTAGTNQQVQIQSPGSEISNVSIALKR